MISLLEEIKEKKKAIFPEADFFDNIKAEMYRGIMEWINNFSKKLNINLVVTIRSEAPKTKIHFYENEEGDRVFNMIVGSPDKLKTYDYYALTHGMFLDFKQNDKKVANGKYYDSALNIMVWIADNASAIKTTIQDAAERELFRLITEEEKELEKLIKVIRR